MATENSTIRIKAERLGTVKEVTKLLKDFDKAYNSIYAFNFLVNDNERKRRILDDKFHDLRKYWKEFYRQKDFPYDPIFFEIFWNKHLRSFDEQRVNLLELRSKIDIEKIMLSSDTLIINKVNIQSPGFWEFLGALYPLQQIREY